MPRARASSQGDETDYSDAPRATGANKKQNKRKSTQKGQSKQKQRRQQDGSGSDSSQDDVEDEEEAAGPSRSKRKPLPEEEKQELVTAMTRHILFTEHTHKPHTRSALVNAVLTRPEHKSRFGELILLVQEQLRDVFGMELVPLRPKENQSKSLSKQYALRSTLPAALVRAATNQTFADLSTDGDQQDEDVHTRQYQPWRRELTDWQADGDLLSGEQANTAPVRDIKREEGASYGILGVILALILVNGKQINDDQLVTYLRRLSLTPSTPMPLSVAAAPREHVTLAKYIDQLVNQGYLEKGVSSTATTAAGARAAGVAAAGGGPGRVPATQRTQRANGVEGGDANIEYRWGARAEVELGELGVAKFIQTIYETGEVDHDAEEKEDDDDHQTEQAPRPARTGGDKLLREIARAANSKELQSAYKKEVGEVVAPAAE
ncbi:hypothetical protein OIO90_003566 [Microbotryomycetes sp. JL221]|nr:hypothetical protein OIO90_003566 [Microbotryomycetes sp. JL221]